MTPSAKRLFWDRYTCIYTTSYPPGFLPVLAYRSYPELYKDIKQMRSPPLRQYITTCRATPQDRKDNILPYLPEHLLYACFFASYWDGSALKWICTEIIIPNAISSVKYMSYQIAALKTMSTAYLHWVPIAPRLSP